MEEVYCVDTKKPAVAQMEFPDDWHGPLWLSQAVCAPGRNALRRVPLWVVAAEPLARTLEGALTHALRVACGGAEGIPR